jgi:CRP/FNR family transcriptional regulator, anaerobic regulatory protein
LDLTLIRKTIPGFSHDFYELLQAAGKIVKFPADQVILKEGAYVNVIPVVLKGLLKVTKKEEDKEILLYYIEPGQSCVMSFSACITNTQSKIFATTEEESQLLLIPSDEMTKLTGKYPAFVRYFFSLYQERYEALVKSIDMLVFKKFDERLILYLREKSGVLNSNVLSITHQEIASDMGTLREVVSRTLKKLEKEGKIGLTRNEIKIF